MADTVKDIMTKKVVVLRSSASVYYAARRMSDLDVSSAIIVVPGLKPLGIITERDLVRRVILTRIDPTKIPVSKIMTSPVRSISPETSIFYASEIMRENNFRRLPVVNPNKKLLGLITEVDIANYFTEKRKQFVIGDLEKDH